ncbi:MAP3K12-binding inhibitory protein 1 isoform X6 [Aphelocoma coerulescens]|uniref:MAP3K12-binding inhibitory protein 1 isoform X6 n=1 Tax=Aphelocoma coerulescens TaxID=39617 RepID=UPI0036044C8C
MAAAAPGPLLPGGRAPEVEPAASEVASSALRCLVGLAGQLNLGGDIVKVVIDWSKLQSTSALQPALLFSALQQHILCLQPLLEKLQSLIKEENIGHVEPAENSCARTDAIFTPYPGFKSHIKVSRVVNTYGPQTRSEGTHGPSHKGSVPLHDCGNQAVEERLQNIEAHLRLQTGGPVPRDIYQRIKKLEDKILELEGLSPEYFQSVSCSGKRRKIQSPHQSYSLAELDEKINAIKQALLRKTKESKSKESEQLLR